DDGAQSLNRTNSKSTSVPTTPQNSKRFIRCRSGKAGEKLSKNRRSSAEILDNCRRISNPGFTRDVHQRLPVDDADAAENEHGVAKSRGHTRRQFDTNLVPLEEIGQPRQRPVAAKARPAILRLARRQTVNCPTARAGCDLALWA